MSEIAKPLSIDEIKTVIRRALADKQSGLGNEQVKLDDELSPAQGGAPWTCRDTFDGNLSLSLWAGDHAGRPHPAQGRAALQRSLDALGHAGDQPAPAQRKN
jgi:hypothetical protein